MQSWMLPTKREKPADCSLPLQCWGHNTITHMCSRSPHKHSPHSVVSHCKLIHYSTPTWWKRQINSLCPWAWWVYLVTVSVLISSWSWAVATPPWMLNERNPLSNSSHSWCDEFLSKRTCIGENLSWTSAKHQSKSINNNTKAWPCDVNHSYGNNNGCGSVAKQRSA